MKMHDILSKLHIGRHCWDIIQGLEGNNIFVKGRT